MHTIPIPALLPTYEAYPFPVLKGCGDMVFDDDGNGYWDFYGGHCVCATGHCHPTVVDAISAQAGELIFYSTAARIPLRDQAARALVEFANGPASVFFCNSGAEAVEAAIKFARASTKRHRILYHAHAYHGLTMGALALNGSAEFRIGFGPLMPDTTEVPLGDLDALKKELRRGDVAALIVEPIQGKGVVELDAERWRALEAAVHEAGALFICDEVQTGLGRTGRFYAFEHYGLSPDIITVSKALSGGFVPVGAMLASDKVFRSVYSSMDRAMVHSTTFKGNQLAMVAGLATLSVFDDERIVEHASAMGDVWRARLEELATRHEFLHEVRGRGQMIGVVFGPPSTPALKRRWRMVEATRTAMFSQTLVVPLFQRYGILTQVAADNMNVIKLLPPLIAAEAEIDQFVNALDELLTDAEKKVGWLVSFGLTMAKGVLRRTPSSSQARVPS